MNHAKSSSCQAVRPIATMLADELGSRLSVGSGAGS
jgi:hypothetical protein